MTAPSAIECGEAEGPAQHRRRAAASADPNYIGENHQWAGGIARAIRWATNPCGGRVREGG